MALEANNMTAEERVRDACGPENWKILEALINELIAQHDKDGLLEGHGLTVLSDVLKEPGLPSIFLDDDMRKALRFTIGQKCMKYRRVVKDEIVADSALEAEAAEPDTEEAVPAGSGLAFHVPMIVKALVNGGSELRKDQKIIDKVYEIIKPRCIDRMDQWEATFGPGSPRESEIRALIEQCNDNYAKRENIVRNSYVDMGMEKFIIHVTLDNQEVHIWDKYHLAGSEGEESQEHKLAMYFEDIEPDDMDTPKVKAIIDKLKRKKKLAIKRSAFDRKRNGIAFRNKFVNFDTYTLEDNKPENLNRVFVNSDIELPDQVEGEWQLKDIEAWLGDTEYWKFLKQCMTIDGKLDWETMFTFLESRGYSLGIDRTLEKNIMHVGKGANGKTVFVGHWADMIGDFASYESIYDLAEIRFSSAELEGKLMNICMDMDSDEIKRTGIIKRVASAERQRAEKKNKDPMRFKPFALNEFVMQTLPPVQDNSSGWFRKLMVIQWRRKFEVEERRLGLREILVADTKANAKLMGLVIRLRQKLFERGRFRYDMKEEEVREMYNKHTETLEYFATKYTRPADGIDTPKLEVYSAYESLCQELGRKPKSKTYVTKYLKDQYEDLETSIGGKSTRVWKDMKLLKPKQETLKDTDNTTQKAD